MAWVQFPFAALRAKVTHLPSDVLLRTPEPTRERRLADRVALAWARFTSRAAFAADKVVALLIDKDIAAGSR